MRGLVGALLAISLVFPAVGRLVGPAPRKTLKKGIQPDSAPELALHASGCPAECACESGDASNGGDTIANGMCYHFCSSASWNAGANSWTRYCGQGAAYTQGQYLDCRVCNQPQYFGASVTLHNPAGKATESIILLGPWNTTTETLGMNWYMNHSESVNPLIRKQSRIISAMGRHVPQNGRAAWNINKPFNAWYGYKDYDHWYKGVPIPLEVDHAVGYIHSLIEQEYKIVGDYRRIILAGLHQGALLSLESALRFPHPLGLVFSERGVLIPSRVESSVAVAATPYILTAGGKDTVYTASEIQGNANYLKAMHVPVFMKTYPELDHFGWSTQETTVALKSFGVALSETPVSTATLASLESWTVAS